MTAKYFEGKMNQSILCATCNQVSDRAENFVDLGVSFPEKSSLNLQLQSMINSEFDQEILDKENNLFYCSHCDKSVAKAVKTCSIASLPQFCIVTLNRFFFDRKTQNKGKIMSTVDIPRVITVPGVEHDYEL
jgi:ubiquitin C-terminal hydrolase